MANNKKQQNMRHTINHKIGWVIGLSFIICHLSLSPAKAQVGTWHNYLAYHDVQQIQAASGSDLFVLASNGLYQYNLQDKTIYTYDKTKGLSDVNITNIRWCPQTKRLVAVYNNCNIDLVETNGNVVNVSDIYSKSMTGDKTINSITINGQYAYLACSFGVVKVDTKNAEISESYMLNLNITAVAFDASYIYARSQSNGVSRAALNTNVIDPNNWQQTTTFPSFTQDNTDYDTYIEEVKTLDPGGPKYNYFGFLRFKHQRLYSCGGGYSMAADLKRPGTVQIMKDGNWSELQDNIADVTGWRYINVLTVDADNDPEHVFVGGQTGLYEFQNSQFVKAYNIDNSPLESNQGEKKHWVLVEGIAMDSNNNLWCLNSGAFTQSILELTNTKTWNSYHTSQLMNPDGANSLYGMCSPFFDSRGLLWFVNYHWNTPSFYCYDIGSKSLIKSYKNLINQDGTSIGEYYNPHCICEDLDGNIWVGTEFGPVLIEKDNIYTDNTYITQVKVPRNDGTNYADYLLSGIPITSIAIDAGGRKWFGTSSNGVYLISADNMTELHHFTISNSALLSNNIESIAINNESGEVFFGTDNGLCSYMSDATTTYDEMTKDNVWAYPNPVAHDYTGLITIVGLTYNADVKILASNGALVAEGRSNGGTFTWDGCDKNGNRVASGVYMVATAKSDGSKGTVCKIAIIH